MNEQKLPSASDLYRDRYQGKLKSTKSPRCPMCGAPELEELELEGIYGEPLIIAACRKCRYRSDEKPTTNGKPMSDERVGELLPEDWKDFWRRPELWCVETWRVGLLLRAFATNIEEHQKAESEITHMLNLHQRTIVERDEFAKLMGTMKGERDVLEKENKELRKALRSEGNECDDMTFKYEALLEKIACAVGVHTWNKFEDNCGGGTVCSRCGKTEMHWFVE